MIIMAKGKMHVVHHKRRRSGRTDYRTRLKLLKSNKPRFVVRKSSNNITCQLIGYGNKGDKVIAFSDSRNLKELGWNGHCGNIPAAYLTGLICGKNAVNANVKEAVFDMGLFRSVKGSRLYAALNGAIDAGLQIPHSDEIMPDKKTINGAHSKNADVSAKEFTTAKEKILSAKDAPKKETPSENLPKKEAASKKPKTEKVKRPI